MPCTVSPDPSTGVVVIVVEGALSIADVRDAIAEIWRTPEYRSHLRVLWDLRNADPIGFSSEELQQVASYEDEKRPELPRSRVAVLVCREVDYGTARMLGAFLPEDKLENDVFRDEGAAWRWLAR